MMRSLRRMSLASIVPAILLLSSAGARAQTAVAPSTQPAANPAPFVTQVPPLLLAGQFAPRAPGPPTSFRVPPLSPGAVHNLESLDTHKLVLLARNGGPCFLLRTYGFTSGHDSAEAPRLSSHTTCTPASESHLKEVVKSPASH